MTAAELIAALQQVPEGCTLRKNAVGNLQVLSADGEYLGYVDLANAEVVLF